MDNGSERGSWIHVGLIIVPCGVLLSNTALAVWIVLLIIVGKRK